MASWGRLWPKAHRARYEAQRQRESGWQRPCWMPSCPRERELGGTYPLCRAHRKDIEQTIKDQEEGKDHDSVPVQG